MRNWNKESIARILGVALIIAHTVEEIIERIIPIFAGAGG